MKISFWRCLALLSLAVFSSSLVSYETMPAEKSVKRVILFSVDTLRPDYLGCYNNQMKTSPNLNQFALENVLFTQVTSQAPSTAISHKSILYSLYPSIHRTSRNSVPVENLKSPLEVLQLNGFKTAAFVGGGELSHKFGFSRGFHSYWEAQKYSYSDSNESLDTLWRKALGWLNRNHSEKFFLFLHTYEAHCPYYPPRKYRDQYAAWYRGDIDPAGKCGDNFYNLRRLSLDDLRFIRDLYAAQVQYIDDFFGLLIQELKRLRIYDDTVIIFLSDHGESLGERGYIGHNLLYNIQLRVPLVMRIPGVNAQRIDFPVEGIDVMPTIFAALKIPPPYPFQGKDLLQMIWKKNRPEFKRVQISEQSSRIRIRIAGKTAIFSSHGTQDQEVYDLITDSEEIINLSDSYPVFLQLGRFHYASMVKSSRDLASKFVIANSNPPVLDNKTIEQLKALGYLQ